MHINWKLRLKNKETLLAIIGAIVVFVYTMANALGVHIPVEQEMLMGAITSVIMVLVALGVIIDPTTEGVNDSSRAMAYEEPNGD